MSILIVFGQVSMRRRRRKRNGKIKVSHVHSVNSESEKSYAKAIFYKYSAVDCVSQIQHSKSIQGIHFKLL